MSTMLGLVQSNAMRHRTVGGAACRLVLIILVAVLAPSSSVAAQDFQPTETGARRLLQQFLEPGADRRALTAALWPSADDYRSVYKEPLASALEERNRGLWEEEPEIGPNEGQTALLIIATTTSNLIANEDVLDEFPGGYKRVLEHMKPDIPIVRFKFVKPGARIGYAFDGLVYVDRRWVLIPKPWRAMK